MVEGWFKFLYSRESKGQTPNDKIKYLICKSVIHDTEFVLREYGMIDFGHEGFVYWAGIRQDNLVHINTVVAPETISSVGRVTIPPVSNFYVIQRLAKENLTHIGQVHTHPSSWVGHSSGDDSRAAFKREGLLSIVVPEYCVDTFRLQTSGMYRFDGGQFIRLSNRYVKQHFRIIEEPGKLIDLRDKNDRRWIHKSGIN